MTMLVVDASVVAKWFFPEKHSMEARRLLSARYELMAPDLVWSEVGNILWKRVGRGDITSHEAAEMASDLLRMPLSVRPTQSLLGASLEIALATQRTVYDCSYLALAIDQKCRLVTADQRFVNALDGTPFSKHIRFVARLR